MSHGVNKKTPPSVSLVFLTTTRSSQGLFVVLNTLLFARLPIWPLTKSYDITQEFMVWKLQAVVFFDLRGT